MMNNISKRELELPESFIDKLMGLKDKNIISLGPGEPDFAAPKPLFNGLAKLAKKSNHYSPPGGRPELKEALIRKLKRDNKINANPENIVVTCGSQEAIVLTILSTLDVNEQIIIPNPSFLGYSPTIELLDVTPVYLPLKEEENFSINTDELKKLIDSKTKAIVINTPANPTGTVLTRDVLEEIADIAIEHDLYILSDEAYEKIIYDKNHISIGSLNGMQDNVITFQTFSKTFAMCGFRLGYCIAPEKLARAVTKIHVYTTICAPTLSQLLGIKALALNKRYIDAMVAEYRRRRDLIVKRLNDIGLKTIKPDGAFYTFSNIKHLTNNSRTFATRLLKEAKIGVLPGTEFGRYGEGYIRCSFATDYKKIELAMGRLERFVEKF